MTFDKETENKTFERNQEQLSMWIDGDLSADEARFLLHRLRHDVRLLQCFSRWHGYGDALRGDPYTSVASNFSQCVVTAIEKENSADDYQQKTGPQRYSHWAGGIAVAASVVVAVSLFFVYSSADLDGGVDGDTVVMTTQPVTQLSRDAVSSISQKNGQSLISPFAIPTDSITVRPWPNHLLPGDTNNKFNTSYGSYALTPGWPDVFRLRAVQKQKEQKGSMGP